MRALRIIYLWKIYNLLKSLGWRKGAVSYEWALWKYLLQADPCQPVSKHHLSIYFILIYLIFTVFFSVWKRIKNSYRLTKNCCLRTLKWSFWGACRLTLPLAARSLSLDANTSFLINKNGWTVNLVPRALFKAREKRPGDEVVGRSVSVPRYLFKVILYSILFQWR